MKKLVLSITMMFAFLVTGCTVKETPGLGAECEAGFRVVDNECVEVGDDIDLDLNQKVQIVADAQTVSDAVELYCLSEVCEPVTEIRWYEVKDYLNDLDEDYYMFDLYQADDGMRVIAIINEDDDIEIHLRARYEDNYEWIDLAPHYFNEENRVDKVKQGNGTGLSSNDSILENTKKDRVIADALVFRMAIRLYCLESQCTAGDAFTYSDLSPYVDGVNVNDYLFGNQAARDSLIIAVFLSDDLIKITLIANDDTDYSWFSADPESFSTSQEKRENVRPYLNQEYSQFDHITNFSELTAQPEQEYYVYYYSEFCSYCATLKNKILTFENREIVPLYAMNVSEMEGTNPYAGDVGSRVPTLFYVNNGEVTQIDEGVYHVLSILTYLESLEDMILSD